MITPEQLGNIEQLRKNVLELVQKGVSDEYLLTTYNQVLRVLNTRLPKIRVRVDSSSLKAESKGIVTAQRNSLRKKKTVSSGATQNPSQKSA
ncbi:hypothetical protein EI42_04811 [Thermosporothrix hazakensis]|jgi:hypothetical protein|uniref:Uncharacterized protein n=1 Tax=Thermosporothrix hazakensis TaxID=644383 RepID=A0A326U152_THEHA|nr:hypothetical protein [Thermosporothrix hazakensis]PZW23888.1 hypothetical protein EI42_04811 [Thermosporothrix hazakensis]GCE48509.1 hypothetical protein KTH_33780 [Thermosporothrix hazakensis]